MLMLPCTYLHEDDVVQLSALASALTGVGSWLAGWPAGQPPRPNKAKSLAWGVVLLLVVVVGSIYIPGGKNTPFLVIRAVSIACCMHCVSSCTPSPTQPKSLTFRSPPVELLKLPCAKASATGRRSTPIKNIALRTAFIRYWPL